MKLMKKILIILVEILIVSSVFMGYKIYAAGEITYRVEQVTNAEDINSKNIYQYILVYETEDGDNYALTANTSSSSDYYLSRNNYSAVSIEGDELTVLSDSSPNIVWNFTKSKNSVLEDGDHPVVQAASIHQNSDRNQLKLSSGGSGGSTGIRFSNNGNGFTFEKTEDNKFKLCENNCETSNNYICFGNYFMKGTADNAVSFKIYKIVRSYNYTSSKFLTSEELANVENVTISKNVSEYENYTDTAIAEVKLLTSGTNYEKTCDILLILDDSTSVYTSAPEDTTKTRAQIIREDALVFAQKLLEINPNNRISVVKFGRNITNEADVDSIGFSSDISDIETMIGGDKTGVSFGTDYNKAFRKSNELMESFSEPTHGKVVIFLSDGMPSIYNDITYTVFSETDDSVGQADNWINYVTNTPLAEAELMKKTGTTIYTVGSVEEDTSMNDSDAYMIPAGTTRSILSNIANGKANFYKFDKIETELESILDNISKDFNYYPTNAIVKDILTSDVNLLTKNVKGYIPQILFKKGDTIVETITFNESGTEVYSDLKPGVNLMNAGKFAGEYISYDGNAVTWDVGDLYKYTYSLEFPIYLNNTVNTYGEGTSRPTGGYSVSNTTQLSYTDVTSREVVKEFENVKLNWVSPNKPETVTDTGKPVTATLTMTPGTESKPAASYTAEGVVNTGDSVPIVTLYTIMTVVILNVFQIKFIKVGGARRDIRNVKKIDPRKGKRAK